MIKKKCCLVKIKWIKGERVSDDTLSGVRGCRHRDRRTILINAVLEGVSRFRNRSGRTTSPPDRGRSHSERQLNQLHFLDQGGGTTIHRVVVRSWSELEGEGEGVGIKRTTGAGAGSRRNVGAWRNWSHHRCPPIAARSPRQQLQRWWRPFQGHRGWTRGPLTLNTTVDGAPGKLSFGGTKAWRDQRRCRRYPVRNQWR